MSCNVRVWKVGLFCLFIGGDWWIFVFLPAELRLNSENSALSLWLGIQSQQMLFKCSSVVSGSSYWEASFNDGPSKFVRGSHKCLGANLPTSRVSVMPEVGGRGTLAVSACHVEKKQ